MAASKPTLNDFKKYLKNLSKDELMTEAIDLFKNFPEVREYYQITLSSDDTIAADKYKNIIAREFFPTRGFPKARLAVAKKAISDFKKLGPSDGGLIDLMLFYVEQGVDFTLMYGDINEAFYTSLEGVFDKALQLINKTNTEKVFKSRCEEILSDTSHIGWGFGDTLRDLYETAFSK